MAEEKPRARDLGIPFEGQSGPLNAITDIEGLEVGHCTLLVDADRPERGKGPIRTGVTAILPRGKRRSFEDPFFANVFSLNGWGEVTGSFGLEEWGFMNGPVMLTNTKSVGTVHSAVIEWGEVNGLKDVLLPVVGETSDSFLNDMDGLHIKKEHVFKALESAKTGKVTEGNVGGGTGMICHEFKGGIGTSSRVFRMDGREHRLGVLVQANHGLSRLLRIAGVPVGQRIAPGVERAPEQQKSSIIVVIATDLPVVPHQLKRVAKRASLGLGATGSIAANWSGDIFLALSTANAGVVDPVKDVSVRMVPNEWLDAAFEATVQATEESIVNALIAAETMKGFRGTVRAIPHDLLVTTLREFNRIREA